MSHAGSETWRVANIERTVGEPLAVLRERALAQLGLPDDPTVDVRLVKRSIDARGNRPPRFIHSLDCLVPERLLDRLQKSQGRRIEVAPPRVQVALPVNSMRPIVLGAGPAGLFAALRLVEAGLRPIVLDRGKPVETRAKDVSALMGQGVVNPESNLCFGEGGAGTWSDGKLYTRIGGELPRRVLEMIVAHGGPEHILVEARPHLGTDRLVALLKAIRASLTSAGAEIRFGARVTELVRRGDELRGVRLSDGELVEGTHLILALGHSARDLYEGLSTQGVPMVAKSFAVGFRVEHPQRLIDEIQYGRWHDHEELPAAYYELAARVGRGQDERGVYSFCMCPGGSVVPTGTRDGELCVNGMSHAARSGKYANSALVVSVQAEEVARHLTAGAPGDGVLAGMWFQREAEQRAWRAGGGGFVAPAQRLGDFVTGQKSPDLRRTTYKRGVVPADMGSLYPDFVTDALRAAVRVFEHRMPGYISEDAVLIGVETRTSAPITMIRDDRTLQSPWASGLYPSGEGAGFAGGIVSAAVDGIRVADAAMATVRPEIVRA